MSLTERSTCQRCGRPLRRLVGALRWRHVPADDSCGDERADPVRPGAALRVLLLALLATRTCQVTLYHDGVEVDGPDDASLLFVGGSFTVEQVAALLGIPADAVDVQHSVPRPRQPGDHPDYTRHDLTVIGEADAWRYRSVPVDGDRSDHFWLAALGVEVMVRRRSDGVYVSVADEGIAAQHGPLIVEVNHSGANTYGDDRDDQ